jgi:hypothetical protein
MQPYSFSVALRVWHPDIDPAVITAEVGFEPKTSWRAGEARCTPKGTALTGTRSESYWTSDPFNAGGYDSSDRVAEDVLSEVLDVLGPRKPFLLLLRQQGARIHIQVSSFSTNNYALELPPEILARSAELGASIVHDVYPYAQDW